MEEENILMGCAFLGVDNFLFSSAVEIICLAVRQVLSPTHTMTHVGENRGRRGRDSDGITQGPHTASLEGCKVFARL